MPRYALRYVSIGGFVVLWLVAALINERVEFTNPALFPSPIDIAIAGYELRGYLLADVGISLFRSLLGFLIAAASGVFLGCVCASFQTVGGVIDPILDLIRPIPPLAFLPIFIIWFGLGELSKVLMIAFSAFFIIYVNTYQGVRYADPILVRAARSMGANRVQIFLTITLPAALPEIITGLRLGMGMSFFVLVAAELIAADSGMGFRIQEARWQFRVDRMFYGAALIGMVGFILFGLLRWIEERLLRWKPQIEQSRM
jgi:ABC-type nitrate/sulfonate/bicarbonate transport system permease component